MDEVLENRGVLKQADVSIVHIFNLHEKKHPGNPLKRGRRSFWNDKYRDSAVKTKEVDISLSGEIKYLKIQE